MGHYQQVAQVIKKVKSNGLQSIVPGKAGWEMTKSEHVRFLTKCEELPQRPFLEQNSTKARLWTQISKGVTNGQSLGWSLGNQRTNWALTNTRKASNGKLQ